MTTGMGIINSRNASGKDTARSTFQPAKNKIIPASNTRSEIRLVNNSAPRDPTSSRTTAPTTTNNPKFASLLSVLNSCSRWRQTTYPENSGVQNPNKNDQNSGPSDPSAVLRGSL